MDDGDVLQRGSRGPRVARVQRILRRLGYSIADEPGEYGESTEAAVRQFQAKEGLPDSGNTDVATAILLSHALAHRRDRHLDRLDAAIARFEEQLLAFSDQVGALFGGGPDHPHRQFFSKLIAQKGDELELFGRHVEIYQRGEDPELPGPGQPSGDGPGGSGGGGEREPAPRPTLRQSFFTQNDRVLDMQARFAAATEEAFRLGQDLPRDAERVEDDQDLATDAGVTQVGLGEGPLEYRGQFEDLRFKILKYEEDALESQIQRVAEWAALVERYDAQRVAWLAKHEEHLLSEARLLREALALVRELDRLACCAPLEPPSEEVGV